MKTSSIQSSTTSHTPGEAATNPWKSLYNVAGVVALIMVVFIPIQLIVFFSNPPPNTVIDWFTFFQNNWIIALLDMDLLLIVDQIFVSVIFLALYIALRETNQSLMAIALVAGLLGIAAYFASSVCFDMLALSNQYAAATTDAQRSMLLAAGQVALTTYQGTAFDVGYVLEGIGLLLTALVMLRSTLFSKTTAIVGIVLGIMSLLPPTAGTIGLFCALGSLIPLVIWSVLIALRFFQLAQGATHA
jgi:hypothetical protein